MGGACGWGMWVVTWVGHVGGDRGGACGWGMWVVTWVGHVGVMYMGQG